MIVFLYLIGVALFFIYDAKVGFHNFEWSKGEIPPVSLAAWLWFMAVPWILVYSFFIWVDKSKKERIKQEQEKERIRIKTERDLQEASREVDLEFDPPERKYNKPPKVKSI